MSTQATKIAKYNPQLMSIAELERERTEAFRSLSLVFSRAGVRAVLKWIDIVEREQACRSKGIQKAEGKP